MMLSWTHILLTLLRMLLKLVESSVWRPSLLHWMSWCRYMQTFLSDEKNERWCFCCFLKWCCQQMNLFKCVVLRGFKIKRWYRQIQTYYSSYYYLLCLYSFGNRLRPKIEPGGQVFTVRVLGFRKLFLIWSIKVPGYPSTTSRTTSLLLPQQSLDLWENSQ